MTTDLIEDLPLPDNVLFSGEGDVYAAPSDADRLAWNRDEDDDYSWDQP